MCEPVSIGMGIMAVAGATMSAKQKADMEGNQIDAQNRQKQQLIKQMSFQDANLKLEARDKAEEAMNQLTQTNLNAIRNEGTVRAAIAESGLEGRSMDAIQRQTEGDSIRERTGITENYQRDYSAIFGNQVANVENTKSQIDGMAPVMRGNRIAQALDVVSAGANAYYGSGGQFGMAKSGGTAAPISAAKGTKTGK